MALHANVFQQFCQIQDGVITVNKDEKEDLIFVKVAENTFRPFNPRTGRFYNLELGIDEMM